jgi:PIN domain nuclease of toxin-antitoxin system
MTKLLFDSHALFWFLDGDTRLPQRVRLAAEASDATLVASAVSAWEFANKVRIGKWPEVRRFAERFTEHTSAQQFELLPITPEHAKLAGFLPGAHRDPFDRMLAAQSEIEQMPLVTADPAFKAFGTTVIW